MSRENYHIITIGQINQLLVIYAKSLDEWGKSRLRHGRNGTIKRLEKMLRDKQIYCYHSNCQKPIQRDTLVLSKRSQTFTKIYHADCYKEY